MTSERVVVADRIQFLRADEAGSRPIFEVAKVGWHWVPLPRASLWARLRAWWRGEVIQTEELREKYEIGIRGDLVVDGPIHAGRIESGG